MVLGGSGLSSDGGGASFFEGTSVGAACAGGGGGRAEGSFSPRTGAAEYAGLQAVTYTVVVIIWPSFTFCGGGCCRLLGFVSGGAGAGAGAVSGGGMVIVFTKVLVRWMVVVVPVGRANTSVACGKIVLRIGAIIEFISRSISGIGSQDSGRDHGNENGNGDRGLVLAGEFCTLLALMVSVAVLEVDVIALGISGSCVPGRTGTILEDIAARDMTAGGLGVSFGRGGLVPGGEGGAGCGGAVCGGCRVTTTVSVLVLLSLLECSAVAGESMLGLVGLAEGGVSAVEHIVVERLWSCITTQASLYAAILCSTTSLISKSIPRS